VLRQGQLLLLLLEQQVVVVLPLEQKRIGRGGTVRQEGKVRRLGSRRVVSLSPVAFSIPFSTTPFRYSSLSLLTCCARRQLRKDFQRSSNLVLVLVTRRRRCSQGQLVLRQGQLLLLLLEQQVVVVLPLEQKRIGRGGTVRQEGKVRRLGSRRVGGQWRQGGAGRTESCRRRVGAIGVQVHVLQTQHIESSSCVECRKVVLQAEEETLCRRVYRERGVLHTYCCCATAFQVAAEHGESPARKLPLSALSLLSTDPKPKTKPGLIN